MGLGLQEKQFRNKFKQLIASVYFSILNASYKKLGVTETKQTLEKQVSKALVPKILSVV